MDQMEFSSGRIAEELPVATGMQPATAAPPQDDKENQVPHTEKGGERRGTKTGNTGTIAAAVVAVRTQPRLLSLPAEIRHMIIGYLANDLVKRDRFPTDLSMFLLVSRQPRLSKKRFGMAVRAGGVRYPVYVFHPVDISLLLVCRQIYHDAVAVLFKSQEIHVEVGDPKVLTRFNRNVMSTLPPSIREGLCRLHVHVRFANRAKSHKPMATHIKQSVHAAIQEINQLASDLPQTPLANLKISWYESMPLLAWEDRKRILSTLKNLRPCRIEAGALEAKDTAALIYARPSRYMWGHNVADLRLVQGTHRFEVEYLQTLVIKRYLPVLAPEKKYAQELAAREAGENVEADL